MLEDPARIGVRVVPTSGPGWYRKALLENLENGPVSCIPPQPLPLFPSVMVWTSKSNKLFHPQVGFGHDLYPSIRKPSQNSQLGCIFHLLATLVLVRPFR